MREMDLSKGDESDIVVVGGGICGLATALALHRKGLRSVVLERADSLRATGSAIGIFTNGWRALDQLGVATKLRQKAISLRGLREISIDRGTTRETLAGKEELRCLRRSDLVETLAEGLPAGTIRFSCSVVGVEMDRITSLPILLLQDGSVINGKIVIGCDGANSIFAESLKLKHPRNSQTKAIRGLTNYQDGHGFDNEFIRMMKNEIHFGRIPIDQKTVYWFVALQGHQRDIGDSRDPHLIREAAIDVLKGFPEETIETVKNSDNESLSYTQIKYRAPWDLLFGSFRQGAMTVAGDAMHVMGPFLGQGGSAGLEDAIVLARCLAQGMSISLDRNGSNLQLQTRVEKAMDKYIKERKMRLIKLSMQSYLVGLILISSSMPVKLIILTISLVFFGKGLRHAQHDCGQL